MIDLEGMGETFCWPHGLNAAKAKELLKEDRIARTQAAGEYNDADLEHDLTDIISDDSHESAPIPADAAAASSSTADVSNMNKQEEDEHEDKGAEKDMEQKALISGDDQNDRCITCFTIDEAA